MSSTSAIAAFSLTRICDSWVAWLTVVFTRPRLSFTNDATSPSAVASSDSAAPRSFRSPARVVETDAKFELNCRTSWSLAASADTNVCSCRIVLNSAEELPDSVLVSFETSVMVWFSLAPWPFRFFAETSSSRASAPWSFAPFGPSATDRSFRLW